MAFFNRSPRPDGAWRFFFIILVPIFFCWIPFLPPWYPEHKKELKMFYILLVHGLYWTTNVIPFVITGFIGIVMLPLLGVEKANNTAETIMKEQTAFLLGQFLLAGVIISTGVTRIIALKFLSISGHKHDRMISLIFIGSYLLAMVTTSGISALVMCDLALWVLKERHEFTSEPRVSVIDDLQTRFLFKSDPYTDMLMSKEDGEGQPKKEDGEGRKLSQVSVSNPEEGGSADEEDEKEKKEDGGETKSEKPSEDKPYKKKANVGKESTDKKDTEKPKKPVVGVQFHVSVDQGGKVPPEPEVSDKIFAMRNKKSMIEGIDFVSDEHYNLMISLKRQYFIVVYTACNIGGLLFPFGTIAGQFLYSCGDNRGHRFATNLTNPTNGTKPVLTFTRNGKFQELDMLVWISYVLPIMLIFGIIAYGYVLLWNMKIFSLVPDHRKFSRRSWMTDDETRKLTYEQKYYSTCYQNIMPNRTHENIVGVFMLFYLILCLTRDPRHFQGWSRVLWDGPKGEHVIVEESAIVFILIILMSTVPRFSGVPSPNHASMPVFHWPEVGKKIMWNVVMLHGGQSVLAEGIHASGLGMETLKKVAAFAKESPSAYHWVVIISASVFTECLGTLTAGNCFGTIMTFIEHPLGTASLPAAVTSSLSFMFPVATPANVIALIAAGYDLRIYNMMAYGFALDIMAIIVVGVYHTLLVAAGFLDFPE